MTPHPDLFSGGPDARWPDRPFVAGARPVRERRQRDVAVRVAARLLPPRPLVTFLTHAELSPAELSAANTRAAHVSLATGVASTRAPCTGAACTCSARARPACAWCAQFAGTTPAERGGKRPVHAADRAPTWLAGARRGPHCPAGLWRRRCAGQHAMADDAGGEGEGSSRAARLRAVAVSRVRSPYGAHRSAQNITSPRRAASMIASARDDAPSFS